MENQTSIVYNSALQNRQELAIAHGALTNSKRKSCFVNGVYPTHLKNGLGCLVWDERGKEYIDFIGGLGTNLLGASNTSISNAILKQLYRGIGFSLPTEIEVKAAESVKVLFPFIDRVRFLKTGSEACSAAIRIARAKTGRELVLSEGYHGWHDDFVSLTPPALGVPKFAAIDKLEGGLDLLPASAAVIIEPVSLDISQERIQWLRDLKDKCEAAGSILIFDEIITGFRFPGFSASKYVGVEPDLICLGKAMANGMPLACVGGRRDLMETDYFVSSTYAGETLSLAAAIESMRLLKEEYRLEDLWAKGEYFLKVFNALWPEKIKIGGYPTRGSFIGDPVIRAKFWQEACKAGILFGPSWFFGFDHMSYVDSVLSTCRDIMIRLKTGEVELEGNMPQAPFAQKVREQSGK